MDKNLFVSLHIHHHVLLYENVKEKSRISMFLLVEPSFGTILQNY